MPLRRTLLVAVPLVCVLLVLAAAPWRPANVTDSGDGPADLTSLPSQADNVAAVALQFGSRAGDGLDEANLSVVAHEGLRG